MRIGIDIDGVLYPWDEAARDAVVVKFGGERLGPSTSWDYLKENLPGDQWAWLWTTEGSNAAFRGVWNTYPGALEAVNALLRNPEHRVHFVTHRDPRRTSILTSIFLDVHFGRHPWAGVHVLQNGTPKHSLVPWHVFIDDKPDTVYSMLAGTGAQVFAPARPWNVELARITDPRFVRYDHPDEVVAWVEAHS